MTDRQLDNEAGAQTSFDTTHLDWAFLDENRTTVRFNQTSHHIKAYPGSGPVPIATLIWAATRIRAARKADKAVEHPFPVGHRHPGALVCDR